MTIDKDLTELGVQLFAPDGAWVDVGALRRSGERSWFESFDSYWELVPRPVLGQIFEEHGPGWAPTARSRLPRWFSHLLPEGRLREAVAEAAQVHREREFFLLARIGGEDLPGGIRVVESSTGSGSEPVNATEEVSPPIQSELGPLKFSLAGVQLKFSVRATDRGLTIPARGDAGDWIAKLPDQRVQFKGVPEAEFAALELARAVGIEVPETRLVDVAEIQRLPDWATTTGGQALLIRRFDRTPNGGRVHAEELAQALNLSTGNQDFKYDSLNFETVARSITRFCGVDALREIVDRIVLSVLLGNGDAHAKNWALCYPDGEHPVLSPAYDILPTVLYVPNDNLGLNLAGSKSFADVNRSDFGRLAAKSGVDPDRGRSYADEAVGRVLDAWSVLGDLLPAEHVRRLTERRDSLRLLRG